MILLIICIILFLLYSLLIIYYWRSWKAVPDYSPVTPLPSVTISIVIAARNEKDNIGSLLTALEQQTYPASKFEVIVVDDHSTDGTASIIRKFNKVKLISLQENPANSYKKKALETGIAAAANELIVITDADCIPPAGWLQTIAAYKEEKGSIFIAAPVVFKHDHSVLQIFQSLDFLVLQGITAAAVYKNQLSLCNGANLAYERNAFYQVNGFAGIDHIASGDDMLLMHKIGKEFPGQVHYIKSPDAIVSTQPMKTWKAFFNQRIRWASKSKYYDDKRILAVLLLVYFFNLSFLVFVIAGFFASVYWWYLLILLCLKTLVEIPFVFSVARFYKCPSLLKYFPFFQPLHIMYTLVAGLFSQFGKYEWKGRRVK